MPSSIEYVRAGKLRALAVTTATRSDALPDVPPLGDFVPGYETSSAEQVEWALRDSGAVFAVVEPAAHREHFGRE